MNTNRLARRTRLLSHYKTLAVSFLALTSLHSYAGSWFSSEKSTVSPATEQQVKSVIENNPEIVYNALVKYQKKQVEAKKESVQKYLSTNARKLFYSPNDGVVGNPQGKTSLLILSDYRCGYCSKARAILDEVIKENDDLRVVVKQLPILGPESKYAAKAATLAQQKNLFTTFDSKLSALEKPITVEKVNTAMRQSGLKEKDITAQKDNLDAVIRETYVHAQNLAVQGAPVLIVANSNLTKVEFIENTMDKKAIQAKLKEIS